MSLRALARATTLLPFLKPTPLPISHHQIHRAISTISPGDIYSQIDSNFVHFFLTPQYGGKRKSLVLSNKQDCIRFVSLSYPGDSPSLFSSVVVPSNMETGLEKPHTVILQQVFELPTAQFEKGKKHGSAPAYLETIQKVQQTTDAYFWSRTMPYEDYCRQLYRFNSAYPDYHYPMESEENALPLSPSSNTPPMHHAISTISPGDIYSEIDSEFNHFALTPQHEGKRKNLVLSSNQDCIRFVPLSHPGDPPSLLLGSVEIPATSATGIPTPLAAIVQQVFEVSSHTFKKGKKHGSAPSYLETIQQAQDTKNVYFWSHTSMHYKDHYKQLDKVERAHPEYHLMEWSQNLGTKHRLVWDQAAVQHAAQKLHKNCPPYLLGAPRIYLPDEPWGKEVWDGIRKNIQKLQKNQGRFKVDMKTHEQVLNSQLKKEGKSSKTSEEVEKTKNPLAKRFFTL